MDLFTEQLDKDLHDRSSFDCGVIELNNFLKLHANQNQSKNLSKTYVAVLPHKTKSLKPILGYYTLSSGQVNCEQLPENIKIKLPKHPVPVARIGRLAVDKDYKKQGIGSFLLHDAFSSILGIAKKIGTFAVVVDAKNDKAKAFYKKYGFLGLQESALTLFLPIKTIQSASKQQ